MRTEMRMLSLWKRKRMKSINAKKKPGLKKCKEIKIGRKWKGKNGLMEVDESENS